MNDIAQIILSIIGLLMLLIVAAATNKWSNNRQEQRCESTGGEFYRAIDSSRSFCKMPKG